MDYHTCQKFQVFQQLFTLYNSAIADKAMQVNLALLNLSSDVQSTLIKALLVSFQKLILKITHEVCRHHAAVYELCEKYGLIPWLHLLINTNRRVHSSLIVNISIMLLNMELGKNDDSCRKLK